MNTKALLCAICVTWTAAAVTAAEPELAPPKNFSPGDTPVAPVSASKTATTAKPSAAAGQPRTKTQTASGVSRSPAKVASATQTVYPPVPEGFIHDGAPEGYMHGPEPGFVDGFSHGGYGPYDDYGCYDPWCEPWWGLGHLKHWGSVEYLLWWRKGMRVPPLVSTGPVPPGNVLFGNANYDFGPQSGARATFGVWLDDHECIGLGGRFFALSDGRNGFEQVVGPGGAVARPFIDANTGLPNAVNVGGALGGAIDVDIHSEVYAAEALFRKRVECDFAARLDWLAGYHFSRINEDLEIRTTTTLPPGPPNALGVFDAFDARNEFHGGAFGLQAEFDRGRFTVGVLSKVALGNMRETVVISGAGNPAATGLQGLLAQNTNIGRFERDEFAVVPEVNLNVGFRASEHIDLFAGYTMIYWSEAVQPGDHIDLTVDVTPNAAPIVNRPQFAFDGTDYWVMGMNFGVQWSY